MISKALVRHATLVVGLLMTYIVYTNIKSGKWTREGRMPTSCRSTLVMLRKRATDNFEFECDKNVLKVKIDHQENPHLIDKNLQYKEIANNLSFIARNTLPESLERTEHVVVLFSFTNINVEVSAEGRFFYKLSESTKPRFISKVLESYFKVKEIPHP